MLRICPEFPFTNSTIMWDDSACLGVAYYRPFFDVDTKDVLQRILLSLLPLKRTGEFLKVWRNAGGRKKPDLYGPVWIMTTLIFLIGVTANISSWFASSATAWTYDFSVIPAAMSLIYGCGIAFPAACWATFRYYGMDLDLIEALCLYGYANAPYIVAALICSIPVEIVRWIALLMAYALCAFFLFHNLRNAAQEGAKSLPGISSSHDESTNGEGPSIAQKQQFSLSGPALICIAQLAYTVTIKILFFSGGAHAGSGASLSGGVSPSSTPSPP